MTDTERPKRAAPGPRNTGRMEPSCLFPDENEIAYCVLGSRRARQWPGMAVVLERHGLPKIDVMFGGRYWPKVREFFDRFHLMEIEGRDPPVPIRGFPRPRDGGVKPRPR